MPKYWGMVDSLKISILLLQRKLEDINNLMLIQNVASIIQILFYIVGSTVAILTYRSAKRVLLNTVNTEYHKRSMDHLEALSKRLFNFSSDEHWLKNEFANDEYISGLIEKYVNAEQQNPIDMIGSNGNDAVREFAGFITSIKSEPFLPEEISSLVITELEAKVKAWDDIYHEKIHEFKADLYNKRYDDKLEHALYFVQNEIHEERNRQACGVADLEKEIDEIRVQIRNYLKSFDPFYKKP